MAEQPLISHSHGEEKVIDKEVGAALDNVRPEPGVYPGHDRF